MAKRIHEEKRGGQVYVSEIENYWCKIKKAPRQNKLYLGKKDLKTGQLIRKKTHKKPLQTTGCYNYGDSYFLFELAKKIGLYSQLKNNFSEDEVKKILALAFYKVLSPGPYYLYPYWADESFLGDKANLTSKDIAHFLADLGGDLTLVEFFFKSWIKHNKAQGVVMFDITSLSSYGKTNEFLDRGYNRDGEVLEQMNIGMLSKKINAGEKGEGHMPLAYKIYPGSINDVVTIENLSKFIESYNLSAEIFVMDKGFYSESNLNTLSLQGISFMLPMSFSTKKSMEIIDSVFDEAQSSKHFFELNDQIYTHVETSKKIGKYTYQAHVFLDKKLRFSQESIFFKKLIETEEAFKELDVQDTKEGEEFFKDSFKSRRKFFTLTKDLRLERNIDQIDKEKRRFGFMIILENKKNLGAKETLILYRGKDRVEKVFNSLKNDINERRNRVHSLEAVRGSMFVNFISLILISKIDSVMRNKDMYKKFSKTEMYKTLKKQKIYETTDGNFILGEISKNQKTIFSAFELPKPSHTNRILV